MLSPLSVHESLSFMSPLSVSHHQFPLLLDGLHLNLHSTIETAPLIMKNTDCILCPKLLSIMIEEKSDYISKTRFIAVRCEQKVHSARSDNCCIVLDKRGS